MNMFIRRSIYSYLLILFVLKTGYQNASAQEKEHWITLFVHGNISVKPYLNCKNVIRLMRDKIEDSEYKLSVDFLRRDTFFYEIQPMHDLGLIRIEKECLEKTGNACAATAYLFDFLLKETGYAQNNDYYTYGWSGLMSHKARVAEAELFYDELALLLQAYKKEGKSPKIRLIGYSHGGNICLNLAQHHETKEKKIASIEQLILLGMPVQVENDFLVTSDLFKNIYHFYSSADKIQRIDPFSFKRFLSRKRFHRHTPENLVQIRIAFLQEELFRHRNRLKKRLIDYSPGHAELWFFGWTPLNYRADFPLYPLALVHLLPALLPSIEKKPYEKHIELFVYLDTQKIKLKRADGKKGESWFRFINQDSFKRTQEIALTYQPTEHTLSHENKHIEDALNNGSNAYRKQFKLFFLKRNNNRF